MVLAITGLCKTFEKLNAVDQLSLEVGQGQVFGLLGPNGCGKTTTLAMILGVARPNAGSYRWFKQEASPAQHRRRIGAILEKPNFCPWLSAEENLKLTAMIRRLKAPKSAISQVLEQVGLWASRKQSFTSYSLGMKQRLAIAAALLGGPEVLVLDEPTNGIDAEGMMEVRELIKAVASAGKTVILASHILDEVEKVCTHVAVMHRGKLLQTGAISQVLKAEDAIELAAADLPRLEQALAACSFVSSIEKLPGLFKVVLAPGWDATQLNQELARQGLFLSHLWQRKKSLETHFLELLGKER